MRLFFDTYIRPATTAFDGLAVNVNNLVGWDRLEFPTEKSKFSIDGEKVWDGTGLELVEGESIKYETGTKKVTQAEYNHLRDTYNNAYLDLLLLDPNNDSFVVVAFRMKTQVVLVVDSGESKEIKIVAARSYAIEATNTFLLTTNNPSCVISGTIYKLDGVTPVAGASVQISINTPSETYTDETDKDGNFLCTVQTLAAPSTSVATILATKTGGWTFPSGQTVTVQRNGEYTKDISATVNGS